MKRARIIVNVISLLFSALSSLYIIQTIFIVFLLYSINEVRTRAYAPSYDFIQYFPLLIVVPVLFAITSLVYLHISLKIRERSRLSWVLALLFLITLPVPLTLVGYNSIEPFILQSNYNFLNRSFEEWNTYTLAVAGAIAVLLVVSYRIFHEEGRSLPKRFKYILGIFFLLIPVPVIVYSIYCYANTYNYRNDYKKIQSLVPFHIYRPSFLLEGLRQESVYHIARRGMISAKPTVEASFNYSLRDIVKGKKGQIILKQSEINKDFEIKTYAEADIKEETTTRTIPLNVAADKSALLKHKKNASYLYYLSQSDTLVVISAFYLPESAVLQFAESLR